MKYSRILSTMTGIGLLLAASCSSNGNGNNNDTADSLPTQMDTIYRPDTVKVDGETLMKFPKSEDALKYMKQSGHWDKYSAGILPRMAEENLEYCAKLLNNKFDYFIVVDKSVMKVILFDKYGKTVKEYGMACARNYGTKHRKADSRTPEGFFTAEGIYNSTDWLFTNDAGYTSPARGQFGPRFIRLKVPNTTQIGIHGTASPGSIGRRCSHGCIRLTNENILDLVKYAKVGMPIIVNPGPIDMRVNHNEGCDVPTITTGATKVVMADHAPKQYDSPTSMPKKAAAATDSIAGAKNATPAANETEKATETAAPEAPAKEAPAKETPVKEEPVKSE